jgi:hypothetical protein
MKSQVKTIFNDWLMLMEIAYVQLTKKEFRELENMIQHEIAFHRPAWKG